MTKQEAFDRKAEFERVQKEYLNSVNERDNTIGVQNKDIDELLLTIMDSINRKYPNGHSKWFDRVKALYDEGKVNNLKAAVEKNLITMEEYEEICGEPYVPDATSADYENSLKELGVK